MNIKNILTVCEGLNIEAPTTWNTKSLHILLKMDFLLKFVHQSKESKHCLSTFTPLNKLDRLSTIFTHELILVVNVVSENVPS